MICTENEESDGRRRLQVICWSRGDIGICRGRRERRGTIQKEKEPS